MTWKCKSGFYLDYGTNLCEPCGLTNCDVCKSSEGCETCVYGFYHVNSWDECLSCPAAIPNCLHCLSDEYCEKCDVGYFRSLDGRSCGPCVEIRPNCAVCNPSSGKCIGCLRGYYLNPLKGNCLKCSPACSICSSTTSCTTCEYGFYLKQGVCSACGVGCKACVLSVMV